MLFWFVYFVCLVFFLMAWFFFCRNLDMEAANFLWFSLKKSIMGIMFGLTISDKFFTVYSVTGSSMHPTFTTSNGSFPAFLKGDIVLVERFWDDKLSHGDVITFKSPTDHKKEFVKRLIALPGDWMQCPNSHDIVKIPEGHCWVEGDNRSSSLDSRHFGPIPLGLVRGRVTHIIWPLKRMSKVERKVVMNRVYRT
ncbi:mitochondrial inner membrane protease subunit 2-like isoform X1 [Zingiber officinale]|uniref:mitochondrial inner membrane protease subunit 2-like isoform X1 n=2 Tax=Zingiber officinale TaxID=94328 RepID=UPI001C4AE36B|nr:mitochondrial inner membrane protease subunit 2-like isoform X1 [Zingiber officinale]